MYTVVYYPPAPKTTGEGDAHGAVGVSLCQQTGAPTRTDTIDCPVGAWLSAALEQKPATHGPGIIGRVEEYRRACTPVVVTVELGWRITLTNRFVFIIHINIADTAASVPTIHERSQTNRSINIA